MYADIHDRASVTMVKICDYEWEIQNVITAKRFRNKGYMRGLMKRVLEDADKEGIILLLTSGVGKDDGSGMTADELVDWYCELGFDAIAPGRYPGTTVMQRAPRTYPTDAARPVVY